MLFTVSKKEDLTKWANKLDSYVGSWNQSISKFEQYHPVEYRSEMTKKLLQELKALLGDKKQAVVAREYQGNPAHEVDLNTYNFTDRVFADHGKFNNRQMSKDRQAFLEYVVGGELNPVTSMLRLYSMVEFEVPVLMYVLSIRSWIKLHEDGVVNDVAWKDINEAMQRVCSKIDEINKERDITARLFQTSWKQARGLITVAQNLDRATQKLEGFDSEMGNQMVQERNIDSSAKQALAGLEEAKESIFSNTRSFLKEHDVESIVPQGFEPKNTKEHESAQSSRQEFSLLQGLFARANIGGDLDSSVRSVQQNNRQYGVVKDSLANLSNQVQTSIGKASALLQIYSQDQSTVRRQYWRAAQDWQKAYEKEMDSLKNIRDPMNVVNYWLRDSQEERVLAIRNDSESLWSALTHAVWVTMPTYIGTLQDQESNANLQSKIANPKSAPTYRKNMVDYQVTTQKNAKLSRKWFALGVTMAIFGIGVVVAGFMFGELSRFGASLLHTYAGVGITSVALYATVCIGAIWRSRVLHTKNDHARKEVIEKITGKQHQEKTWWRWPWAKDKALQTEATPNTNAAPSSTFAQTSTNISAEYTEQERDRVENSDRQNIESSILESPNRGRYG